METAIVIEVIGRASPTVNVISRDRSILEGGSTLRLISIRKHLERLSGEERLRKGFLRLFNSIIATTRERILVTDAEDHAWFCASLDSLQKRLQEDPSPGNIEVVTARLAKTLEDHWVKLTSHTHHREEELKRIINLLAEGAGRLDVEHKTFYLALRNAVQNFQNISQIEDITYMRKRLSEQVAHLEEAVSRQEGASLGTISRLQQELDEAHKQIAVLTQSTSHDQLTRLPARRDCERPGVCRGA